MARLSPRKLVEIERERRAWALRSHGWTQERIGLALGIDQGTVSRLLASMWARERDELAADVALERAMARGQIEHLYDEAMQAWERSKLPIKRASQRTTTEDAGGGDQADGDKARSTSTESTKVATIESIEQTGSTAYWNAATAAWDRRNRLLGLDAPPKLAVEDDTQPGSVSSIAMEMTAAGAAYDADAAAEATTTTTTDDQVEGTARDGAAPATGTGPG